MRINNPCGTSAARDKVLTKCRTDSKLLVHTYMLSYGDNVHAGHLAINIEKHNRLGVQMEYLNDPGPCLSLSEIWNNKHRCLQLNCGCLLACHYTCKRATAYIFENTVQCPERSVTAD
ncbi:hypothetical protein Trydic_g561 [Trypoxylus dichotomus]